MKTLSVEKMECIEGGSPYTPYCEEILEFIFTEDDQGYWMNMFFAQGCHTNDWMPN